MAPILFSSFSTFDSLSCILKNKLPISYVLVYRSPKLISGFIQEFSDLLSVIMLQYERFLILGNFNIHVCCPSSSLFTLVDFAAVFKSCIADSWSRHLSLYQLLYQYIYQLFTGTFRFYFKHDTDYPLLKETIPRSLSLN